MVYGLMENTLHIINVHDSGVCEGELEIKDQREQKILSNSSS